MIEYINRRLNDWADWCAKGRRVVGLGYPNRVAFYRLAPVPSTAMTPLPDEECWEIEQAVHRLPPPLREVVDQFYRRAGTATSHAKALHVSRETMYARLHQAHVSVMVWLQVGDEEADDQENRLTTPDSFGKKAVI